MKLTAAIFRFLFVLPIVFPLLLVMSIVTTAIVSFEWAMGAYHPKGKA